ncbi:aldo/keto reductase [Streptomyces sp. NPDC001621]|uniref:aldo/keto reductase n=1 Tax=Streptomyces sp. NPDC001621 TaxID=3364594 RepID=UPI00367BD6DC
MVERSPAAFFNASRTAAANSTPAQVAQAWLTAEGEHIVPIPGTEEVARVEENVAADSVELAPEQMATLDSLPPAAGSAENDEARRRIER